MSCQDEKNETKSEFDEPRYGYQLVKYLQENGLTKGNVSLLRLNVVHKNSLDEGLYCFSEPSETGSERAVFHLVLNEKTGTFHTSSSSLNLEDFPELKHVPMHAKEMEPEDLLADITVFRSLPLNALWILNDLFDCVSGIQIPRTIISNHSKEMIDILRDKNYIAANEHGDHFTARSMRLRIIDAFVRGEIYTREFTEAESVILELYKFKMKHK